jgi:two-component system, NtrC family, response regulator AtoC
LETVFKSALQILLVCRDQNAVRVVVGVCQQHAWSLVVAPSGLEALEQVESGTLPRLVILDLVAGDAEALHTLRRLRRAQPFVPVLVLADPGDKYQMSEAVHLGAEDCVVKPIDPHNIERALLRHFQSSVQLGTPVAVGVETLGDNFLFVASSPAARRLRARASLLAQVAVPVLITGENGSGRETVARLIHKLSIRSEFPFVKVNCALLPPEIIEREIWGASSNGTTHANANHDQSRRGSTLLDEVDSLPNQLQSKLLHYLQSREIFRTTGDSISINEPRLMASTSVDAEVLVATGRLREDLWQWLSTFVLHVPSVRERQEEIPLLLTHFMNRLSRRYGLPARKISPELATLCQRYSWPGNLREMEVFVKRYLVMGDEAVVKSELLQAPASNVSHSHAPSTPDEITIVHSGAKGDRSGLKSLLRTVKGEAERAAIADALEQTQWNRKAAARLLNISYRALLYKIQHYQMVPPETYFSGVGVDGPPSGSSHK